MFAWAKDQRVPIPGSASFLFKQGLTFFERREHSWPLEDQGRHFDLAHVLNCAITDTIAPAATGSLTVHHAGLFEYEFASDRLIWSGGVYDMFGLERRIPIDRERALAMYSDASRATLEKLRTHALETHCGFTLDVKIRPEVMAESRWIRIIAAPVVEDGVIIRLHGVKLAI